MASRTILVRDRPRILNSEARVVFRSPRACQVKPSQKFYPRHTLRDKKFVLIREATQTAFRGRTKICGRQDSCKFV